MRSLPIGTIDGVRRATAQQRTLLRHLTAQSSLIWTTLSGRPLPRNSVIINQNPLPTPQQARSQPQGPPNPISVCSHHQGPRMAPRGNRHPDMTSSQQTTRQACIHGPTRSQARTIPTPLMDIPTRPLTPTRHMPSSFLIALRAKSDSISCQLCLGTGHTAVKCKSKDSQCFKCSQYGHLARVCPT